MSATSPGGASALAPTEDPGDRERRPERWIEIDARASGSATRSIDACELVGGIPLFVRPLRQGARLGWTGARVITRDGEAAARHLRALARHPAPPGFEVEITSEATPA